ncbi:protein kinase domain-containing protein [Streptomyces sp. DT24]|uniref:serine/threonine-protein kinase n=1 Tax=Streptomyces sp. DT24 TaxID=3416520 RepID=UPI003CF5E96F
MQPLEAGDPRTVGAYRLLGRLGAGGMGRVYLGRSAGGRTVAVKVVHPHFALDEEFRARFRREVEAGRRVGAQWTAAVLDADPDAPVPWVATGYVAGPALSQAVTEHGPLPEYAVRTLGAGLAEALTAVHAQGLIHRDVKPSNVLLALDGPRLIDFGIARATDATASLTSTGVSVGSPGYMAPEQIRGQDISGAADVFSLGAVLVYAATGSAPFLGDSSAVLLYKVVHEEPELAELEGGLREAIARCLAKDPADRPSPAELARQLAPGGAGPLVAGGWLPGQLVREVSRAAVALLDLEPRDEPEGSGPVSFSSPAVGGAVGARPGDPVGGGPGDLGPRESGPPPGPPSAGRDPRAPYPYSYPAPSPYPAAFPLPSSELPSAWPDDDSLTGGVWYTGPRPDGSGRPTPSDRDRDRGRRLSCTVTLAVASALAAVTVAGAYLSGLLPGTGEDAGERNGGVAQPPAATSPDATADPHGGPATTASAPAGGADQVTELPERFVGTWKGPTTERTGAPHGMLTVVFTEGRKGTDVVRLTQSVSALGTEVTCHSIGRLSSATRTKLKVRERVDPDRAGSTDLCTADDADLTFALTDEGSLHYQSEEEGAGLPRGTLTRSAH